MMSQGYAALMNAVASKGAAASALLDAGVGAAAAAPAAPRVEVTKMRVAMMAHDVSVGAEGCVGCGSLRVRREPRGVGGEDIGEVELGCGARGAEPVVRRGR